MKSIAPEALERLRATHPTMGDSPFGAMFGWFVLPVVDGKLRIMSSGTGHINDWEHVSVSHPRRVPTWDEMCRVKALFWHDSETVVQFHPKRSEYVNTCEFCLHLWKRTGQEYVLPPKSLVG
jgi:hypothetical protein